jgi:hypothetical protein
MKLFDAFKIEEEITPQKSGSFLFKNVVILQQKIAD